MASYNAFLSTLRFSFFSTWSIANLTTLPHFTIHAAQPTQLGLLELDFQHFRQQFFLSRSMVGNESEHLSLIGSSAFLFLETLFFFSYFTNSTKERRKKSCGFAKTYFG